MELNQIIFPAPKCTYKEEDMKELIKIPYYQDLFKFFGTSPKTRVQFHKISPFKPPEEIPNDVSSTSIYDDQIDELPSQRIPRISQTSRVIIQPRASSNTLRLSLSPRGYENINPFQSVRNHKCSGYIPCLYLKAPVVTKKTIIYFHANCEDLKTSYNLVDFLRHNMRMNVVSVEYPGYGLYMGQPSEESIIKDAEYVYKFIAFHSEVQEQNIIIMGRSIGTGVACHVASVFKPSTLVLISPFLSLQEIVSEKYPLLRKMIKDRFLNYEKILKVKSATYILHGLKDTVINVSQARKLYGNFIQQLDLCQCPCLLRTPPEMTHIRFQFDQDLAVPLLNFMRQLKLL